MRFDEITSTTQCSNMLGGRLKHYPQMRRGMAPTIQEQGRQVMTAICSSERVWVLLVPPQDKVTSGLLCRQCARSRAEEFAAELVAAQ